MGKVISKELANGNFQLEITYGGTDASFGGVDTSAPPAYIDPRCFASVDGFLVVNNKLVVASLASGPIPTLWGGVQATPLKFGNYLDSVKGRLNYALGVVITVPVFPNALVWQYAFYLTVWDVLGNIVDNLTLDAAIWQNYLAAEAATLTIPLLMGEDSTYTDTGHVGISYGTSGALAGSTTVAYAPGMTVKQVVANLVTALGGATGVSHFSAAASADGTSIVLTALTAGAAGNTLCIQDDSSSDILHNNPAFYFPFSGWNYLGGGADQAYSNPPSSFSNISAASVGGTLYFANLGPLILKYKTPGIFAISSAYAGQQVLAKFAGSLIGLGNIPQIGTTLQNASMMFSWSSPNDLDEWNPVTSTGLVTGAGFAQLADIDDALKFVVVANNTAFIVRSQGVSYASPTGNSIAPYNFAHISLGDTGEGAQNTALCAQYDQIGAYVGNTDVFQISGGVSSIGEKIKSAIIPAVQASSGPLGATIFPCSIGGNVYPLLMFMVGNTIYAFNAANGTWVTFQIPAKGQTTQFLDTLASIASSGDVQVLYNGTLVFYTASPLLLTSNILIEGIDGNSLANISHVTFPQEEIAFGREVTIDALYVALNANVVNTCVVSFYINGSLFAQETLDPTIFNSLTANPVNLQIFPTSGSAFTTTSPQLQVTVNVPPGSSASVRFTKISIFASIDSNQRPV